MFNSLITHLPKRWDTVSTVCPHIENIVQSTGQRC